jgi:hypothetical protein
MRLTTYADLRLVGLAVLLVVSAHAASPAQETEQPRRVEQPAAQGVLSEEPQDVIVFTLWVLSIGNAPEPETDELSATLASRVDNLPARFSSIKDVRDLVGQLSVAGMLRKAREFRFTTLNGQPVHVQSGNNQPRIIATNISQRPVRRSIGRTGRGNPDQPGQQNADEQAEDSAIVTNSVQYEQIGTVIRLVPRIDDSKTGL